jgi:enoyl-[acyl-carrier protein] reductase II
LKNNFFMQVKQAEEKGLPADALKELLGKGRAKKGMFEGDMEEGELEIGQVSTLIKSIQPAADIVKELWTEFQVLLHHPLK